MLKRTIYSFFLFLLIIGCSSTKESSFSNKEDGSSQQQKLTEENFVKYKFFFFNGNREKALGNYQEALGYFKQCTEIDPQEGAPYYEMGNLLDLIGNVKQALPFAKKAVDVDPTNYWYRIAYAHLLQKSGDIQNAMQQYEYLLKQDPEQIELYYEMAGMQLYIGKYQEAIKSYDKVEQKTGVSEEISMQKQKVYIKLNDIEGAANEIKNLIRAFPNDLKYKAYLAELYMANNMETEALKVYQEILEEDPNDSYTHIALYEHYQRKNDSKNALIHVKEAFRDPNMDIDIKMRILLSYYNITESDDKLKSDAFQLNKILINTHPEEAKAYTIYADFLFREDKLEGAKENYLKAIKYDSSKFAIWSQVLLIESELSDYEGMERDSKAALELFPNQPMFYFFYSACMLNKKAYEEAVTYLTLGKDFIIANDPLLTQFYANLGDAYHNLEQYQKSDSAYDKALEIDPNNAYVLNNYSYYLSLRNEKLDRAEEMSLTANNLEPDQPSYEDTYAWILYRQGKFIQAKEWIEKALSNGGETHVAILEHYGDVMAKLNNLEKAVEQWKKAKSLGEGSKFLDQKILEKRLYE